jgi:hypothetical protein
MRKRNARALFAAWLAAVSILAPSLASARSNEPDPPDLFDGTFPGVVRPGPGQVSKPILDGSFVHNCGQVLLHITNFGLIGSRPGSNASYSGAPSAQWPKGSPTEYLWSAGLWLGADKNAEKRVSTGQFRIEFRPGRGELDIIYRTREGALGGARLPAPNADDDRDGRLDEDWLNGRDDDGDGRIDEDFAAISNQMFFCEYNDSDPQIKLANPEHVPLDFYIQQSSLCWESPLTDDFIAFDFKLINRGLGPLADVYLGFFADCDIGPREGENVSEDDYAGFWEDKRTVRVGGRPKTVRLSLGYMFDDDGDEGKSDGYIGLMFLGAQDPNGDGLPRRIALRNFRMFAGSSSYDQGGDPTNDEQRYDVLRGTAPKSLGPPNPETGFRPTQLAKKRDDYRMVVSAGRDPNDINDTTFGLIEPGDTLQFQAALVIGNGFSGMVDNAIQAQLTFDGAYLDCDEDPSTGVNGRETALCPPDLTGQTFCYNECDSTCACSNGQSMDPMCRATVQMECIYVNADCELEGETGEITGEQGKECLVHWLIGTAPPPPNMRIVAHEGSVDILWNNRSETTPDLRLAVVDFESYRIWRADNWTRPFGSDVTTGPGGNLWALMAEYDLPNNGVGADTGLDDIRYTPAIPDRAIQYYKEWFEAHPFLPPPELPGFTEDQQDTAQALARGVRYYRFVDPPILRSGRTAGPCPASAPCASIQTDEGPVNTRCDKRDNICREVAPSPHAGAHYFYSVTATDHKLEDPNPNDRDERLVIAGPGLAGDPSSNFTYLNPPTAALPPERAGEMEGEIYVVPNPATPRTMAAWQLSPNNTDPTGTKIEFHHLPQSKGTVTIFTLSGDMVDELPFDGTSGNGSLAWDLVSRNGQDITSGVYLFAVEAENTAFKRFVGKFVVVR